MSKIQLSIKLTDEDSKKFIKIKEFYGLRGDADTFRLCLSDSYRVLKSENIMEITKISKLNLDLIKSMQELIRQLTGQVTSNRDKIKELQLK